MNKGIRKTGVIWAVIISWLLFPQCIYAEIDLTLIKQADLDVQPLDIAASADGASIFVLARGEILIYGIAEGKVTNRVSVDSGFDRVTSGNIQIQVQFLEDVLRLHLGTMDKLMVFYSLLTIHNSPQNHSLLLGHRNRKYHLLDLCGGMDLQHLKSLHHCLLLHLDLFASRYYMM